ncbi:hypothetical protein BN77_0239 [Rhizobium mesoamericanum STM3625]|uniref:Uncharacterized protein n=1 Tax=Rhizobium mesoamericanum STM3625 TaxID=1211777 RepID=K0PLH4_9HYPH|nr:hypothetical protein BN77_0239 [Rhizobium mesoamericanum STM3625]
MRYVNFNRFTRTKDAVYASLQRCCNKGITQTKKLTKQAIALRKELDFNRFSDFDTRVFACKRKSRAGLFRCGLFDFLDGLWRLIE